jgi:hypothetical protein
MQNPSSTRSIPPRTAARAPTLKLRSNENPSGVSTVWGVTSVTSRSCGSASALSGNPEDEAYVGAATLDLADSVFATPPTATPLPSTWSMLIAGFVGLGFFAYRGAKKGSAALTAA